MTHITEAATVIIPVADQERALEFYVGTLGFRQRADFEYGEGDRWVEVEAREGAKTGYALVGAGDGRRPGVETGVALATSDVEADHADLRSRGADVDDILREGDPVVHWAGAVLAGTPPMFLLRDPDGNSFLVVQQV